MNVIIAIFSYNKSDTIEGCIRTVLEQALPTDKVIVLDDCSTDGTQNILRTIQKSAPNLELYMEVQNRGISSARNHILEKFTDYYIIFLDGDDFWLKDHRLLLEKNKRRNSIVHTNGPGPLDIPISHSPLKSQAFRLNMSNSIFFNDIGSKVRFPPIAYGEDLIFWLSITKIKDVISIGNQTIKVTTSNIPKGLRILRKLLLILNILRFRLFLRWLRFKI